jgi:hypothetical protein
MAEHAKSVQPPQTRRGARTKQPAAQEPPPITPPHIDPGPQWPSLRADELRTLTGLTDRRHRQLADQGYFRPPVRGVYGPDVVAGLFRYFADQLHKKNDKLALEQYELTKAKRETVQEELALLREQYVLKSDIGPALRNLSLHQRAVLQRKLENELAPTLSTLKTVEILERIRRAVDDICAVFRAGTAQWLEVDPETSNVPPPMVPIITLPPPPQPFESAPFEI